MAIDQEYREIYQKEIIEKSKGIIFSYSPMSDTYKYLPFSHNVGENAVEDLATIMRQNLPFYCYGEEEVVNRYKAGQFGKMEDMIKFSFKQRLPDRSDINDGLLSETLLDLLIQIYTPNAYKMAVRTLFRQNDRNEIKGYDLTYFTKDDTGISLWLGQAKLGEKTYCKSDIDNDLNTKFVQTYLSKQMFFICDKPAEITADAKEILRLIERINMASINENEKARAKELVQCFSDNHIKIVIPCLLAYGAGTVYQDFSSVYDCVMSEIEGMKKYYGKKVYTFDGFNPEIIFYVFPIEDVERIRNKETGFYAGLC